ncbi:hypothetical protein SAMN04488168_101448 [Bacillus sp. 491mf]|nr:hypothetical protein SAMN04488168_101448 [Bacillus sp. 491mf]
MWIRFVLIGFFSLTAMSLIGFQLTEIFQAYSDMFFNKN